MNFKTTKADLQEALTLTRGSVRTDNPVDTVYESVMFEACQDGVWVNATDGTIWSRILIGAKVKGWDPVMIKSSNLSEIVSHLDDGDLEIEFDGRQAILSSGSYVARFGAANAMEFPACPKPSHDRFTIQADKFVSMVRAVEGSAETKADRPYLQGVNFSLYDGNLEVVATDGYRMAISRCAIASHTAERGSLDKTLHENRSGRVAPLYTPLKAMGTCGSRMARQWLSLASVRPLDGNVSFGFQDGWGFMVGESAQIVGLLPDQRFPDFRSIPMFPKSDEPSSVIILNRKILARAVKRVCAVGAKLKGSVGLTIETHESGAVWLIARGGGKDARDRVDGRMLTKLHDGFITRRIGGDYLRQALDNLSSDEVKMVIPDHEEKPVCVSDGMTEHWLMPRK